MQSACQLSASDKLAKTGWRLAELVGGLTLGRTHVEAPTADLFSNTIYTSAKLYYQGTGFRFAHSI
jgi:hypothetical protein